MSLFFTLILELLENLEKIDHFLNLNEKDKSMFRTVMK